MSIDPFSGRNPSYCFIDLDDSEGADAVIEQFQGHLVRGRPIKINYDAGKRAEHRPKRLEIRMANGERRSFDLSPTSASPFVFDRYARTNARKHWTKPIEEGRRLYVGGLSDICDQAFVNEEMQLLFKGHNIQAVSKRILPVHRNMKIPATGQCYCFVDLPSAAEAVDSMVALDGTPTPYGGLYKINIASDQCDRKVCRERAGLLGLEKVDVAGEVR
jgi:hypothetical protein